MLKTMTGLIILIGVIVLSSIFLISFAHETKGDNAMNYKPLSCEEEDVILHKGTERAFSGKYVDYHADGAYRCRRCGAPLFSSAAKFDSRSGWPSFDEALPGAVKEIPDADGIRTEIVCAHCGAHLGHVFYGEGFTKKNTRHCVNSISMDFESAKAEVAAAYFAGGCFWGVEYYFQQQTGVLSAESGYMGGHMNSPSYEDVKTGRTGHAEAVRVAYDPGRVTYEALAKLFFEIHDPAQVNRQGPDMGTQYRSVVFYADEEQKRVAEKLIGQLKEKGLRAVTQVVPAGTFWKAEEYHQDYYFKTGGTPYCHIRIKRFD